MEMPVLDNAVENGILAFAPMMFMARHLPLAVTACGADAASRGGWCHWGASSSRPSTSGLVHGGCHPRLFFGRVAPPRQQRRTSTRPRW